jgi:hypothetical protein
LTSFYEPPILNSPYRALELHHPLDKNGQPPEGEPRRGRRPSRFIVPVPASRKKAANDQASLDLRVPAVNTLGGFGRRGFEEFRDWAAMEEDFAALVDRLTGGNK